jgi:hypothetical protein
VLWSAGQRDWAQARVIVPRIAVVATMLLAATLEQHLDRFYGLFESRATLVECDAPVAADTA